MLRRLDYPDELIACPDCDATWPPEAHACPVCGITIEEIAERIPNEKGPSCVSA